MEKEGNNLFQVNLKGMIALLSEHIYSNPNTFVRELLQNCVDAITALRNIDENYKGRIDVFLNGDKTHCRTTFYGDFISHHKTR